eukprot:402431_1
MYKMLRSTKPSKLWNPVLYLVILTILHVSWTSDIGVNGAQTSPLSSDGRVKPEVSQIPNVPQHQSTSLATSQTSNDSKQNLVSYDIIASDTPQLATHNGSMGRQQNTNTQYANLRNNNMASNISGNQSTKNPRPRNYKRYKYNKLKQIRGPGLGGSDPKFRCNTLGNYLMFYSSGANSEKIRVLDDETKDDCEGISMYQDDRGIWMTRDPILLSKIGANDPLVVGDHIECLLSAKFVVFANSSTEKFWHCSIFPRFDESAVKDKHKFRMEIPYHTKPGLYYKSTGQPLEKNCDCIDLVNRTLKLIFDGPNYVWDVDCGNSSPKKSRTLYMKKITSSDTQIHKKKKKMNTNNYTTNKKKKKKMNNTYTKKKNMNNNYTKNKKTKKMNNNYMKKK